MTDIERLIIQTAKDYLSWENKNVIVIDLFAREKNYQIKIIDEEVQTHSVVLYKQENYYIVIDPNNSEFSTILASI